MLYLKLSRSKIARTKKEEIDFRVNFINRIDGVESERNTRYLLEK